MDLSELELPEPGLPACPLLQESWEAAGISTDTADMHAPAIRGLD